jgi:hypothetical protein
MNECSAKTKQFVRSLVQQNLVLEENIYDSDENIKKYPMMRRIFHSEDNPIDTDYVMWFDDDSYIKEPTFLADVRTALAPNTEGRTPDMLGACYTIRVAGSQQNWIKDQSWYDNKPISQSMKFATGGWWTLSTETMRKFNYPYPELLHRGGDVMLGALMQQQSLWLRNFRKGVAINADENGNESKAKRRGYDEKPIGMGYVKGQKPTPPPKPETRVVSEKAVEEVKAHSNKPNSSLMDLDL